VISLEPHKVSRGAPGHLAIDFNGFHGTRTPCRVPPPYDWRQNLPTAAPAPFSQKKYGWRGQRRSMRISTRGKPPETAVVSAALTKPASSKTERIPTYAIVRSTFWPWLSTG
jgi:hypothetical protein